MKEVGGDGKLEGYNRRVCIAWLPASGLGLPAQKSKDNKKTTQKLSSFLYCK